MRPIGKRQYRTAQCMSITKGVSPGEISKKTGYPRVQVRKEILPGLVKRGIVQEGGGKYYLVEGVEFDHSDSVGRKTAPKKVPEPNGKADELIESVSSLISTNEVLLDTLRRIHELTGEALKNHQ